MNKKAQAASEFLITYGFAILAVTAAIAAISYAVVTRINVVPETCFFPAEMSCVDKPSIKNNEIMLALKNNRASQITITEINITGCTQTGLKQVSAESNNKTYTDLPVLVDKQELFLLKTGCNFDPGQKYNGNMIVKYTNLDTGLENIASGEIKGRIV